MKHLLLIALFLFGSSSVIIAQNDEDPITKFLIKRGYIFPDSALLSPRTHKEKRWPDTLYYNTPYKPKLMGSITLPFLSSGIEISRGKYGVNPTVNMGLGYTWFWGDFIFNENDKITVDPKVFFGVVANTGLESGLNFKEGGLYASGFIGISSFTLIFGYDIINKSPSLGVGGRIDLYSISQKFLHVLGRVHEVRRHKKIAIPITRE